MWWRRDRSDRRRTAPQGVSRARRESNAWLRRCCSAIDGEVLSIGSRSDDDGEGSCYRDYFTRASRYITSEVEPGHGTDLQLDVRAMPSIEDGAFDCVLCSGVLEHVDEYRAALDEITRILRHGGTLLLGLPFRQPIHLAPLDFWRFTEHGIRHLLDDAYEDLEIAPIDAADPSFPASYWTQARKRQPPLERR